MCLDISSKILYHKYISIYYLFILLLIFQQEKQRCLAQGSMWMASAAVISKQYNSSKILYSHININGRNSTLTYRKRHCSMQVLSCNVYLLGCKKRSGSPRSRKYSGKLFDNVSPWEVTWTFFHGAQFLWTLGRRSSSVKWRLAMSYDSQVAINVGPTWANVF